MRRLTGQETEYAIRFTPAGSYRPSNARIYNAILGAVARQVHAVGDAGEDADASLSPVFVANGGAFNYEATAGAIHGGLLEGATPECLGALELVTYQRAQESLLCDALQPAMVELANAGYSGELSLLKNCRDAAGHIYGTQENYTVEIARGWRLVALRAGLVLVMPLQLALTVGFWLLVLVLGVLAIPLGLLLLLAMLLSRWTTALDPVLDRIFAEPFTDPDRTHQPLWARFAESIDRSLGAVSFTASALVARAFALHDLRRGVAGFVVSRTIFTGAGTLDGDVFRLSEKAGATRFLMRVGIHPDARGIFDASDVLRASGHLLMFRFRGIARAFRRAQRLQLTQSDANMSQSAELLKVGTMLLVLEMLDAGQLDDAPRPRDPVQAMRVIDADPTLQARIPLTDGTEVSAIELQQWYLLRARDYVANAGVVSMETHRILSSWGRVLEALQSDPESLVGTVDWVTKRHLLERCEDLSPDALQKVDLKYHDIVDGYFKQLEHAGVAETVVDPVAVAHARLHPPPHSPAAARAELIAELSQSGQRARIDWDHVRIGGLFRGRIIVLNRE